MTLYESIKSSINTEGLNQLEIARLLYIELNKRLTFSTKFQNTDMTTFAKMYKAKVDVHTFEGNQVNCVMWSQLYSQLLTEYNIPNKIIDTGHQYVEFIYNNEKWVADATYGQYTDLAKVHNNEETRFFGKSMYQNQDKSSNYPINSKEDLELIKKIDEKIGYKTNRFKTLRAFLNDISEGKLDIFSIVDNPNTNNPIELKFQVLMAKVGVLTEGFYEAKDFIRSLCYALFTHDEINHITGREIKRTHPNGEVEILQIICLENKGDYTYYLLEPNQAIREVPPEIITRFALIGFGVDGEIPGLIYPQQFIPGERIKPLKYKIDRFFHALEIKPISRYASLK